MINNEDNIEENILDRIIENKKQEVWNAKQITSIEELESLPFFLRSTNSLVENLKKTGSTGIIAEFKRASPSKGIINGNVSVQDIVQGYVSNGAAGVSVLTDQSFFHGSPDDLMKARQVDNSIPLLRKDFMVDEYQLVEAKAWGADVILLIAACLTPAEVQQLAIAAHNLGLEVLLEIHNPEELKHICEEIDLVGVNNRDLKTFVTNIESSIELSPLIPPDKLKISESGIRDAATIQYLRKAGFEGFLIGENFMKETDPSIAFARFVETLQST